MFNDRVPHYPTIKEFRRDTEKTQRRGGDDQTKLDIVECVLSKQGVWCESRFAYGISRNPPPPE